MENGQRNNRFPLEKRIFYLEHSGRYLMICALSDYSQNKHTVVMANFIYPDEKRIGGIWMIYSMSWF